MITSFRSKALRVYFTKNDSRGFAPDWRNRITMILDLLNTAKRPADMNLPGLDFHPLKGPHRGRYAVSVSGNYRITFAFDGEDVVEVDLEDYH